MASYFLLICLAHRTLSIASVTHLQKELLAARKRLDHFDQVLAPKYQQHAQVSRENEARLKQLLESERQQKSEMSLEIQSLKVRLQTALGEITALKNQLSIKEDEAKQLELSLQTVQAHSDAHARARSPEAIHNAVTSAVGGVRQEYESRIRSLEASLTSSKKEYESQIAVLSQQLVLARKREADIDSALNEWRTKYEQLSAAAAADRAAHGSVEANMRTQRAELDAVQANNRRLSIELQAAMSRAAELEAGLRQAASLAATRERERCAQKEKALQDYILHLNHVISVLEDTIAKRLRDPKFRSSPTIQSAAQQSSTPTSRGRRPQSARPSGGRGVSSSLGSRPDTCSHHHDHDGSKTKAAKCLTDLRAFTGCCHDVKHAGVLVVGPNGPQSIGSRRCQSARSSSLGRSRSRSPSRSACDSYNAYAGLDLQHENLRKGSQGVQWAEPLVQPWIPSSGVTSISSRPQHDPALVLPATLDHPADPSGYDPSDLTAFLAQGKSGSRLSEASARPAYAATAGIDAASGDPSFASLTRPPSGSPVERMHFADPVRSALLRTLETELAQLTAQYTQAVSHFLGSHGKSHSRSLFESRNDDEAVTAVLNIPAFKKLARQIAKRREAIYKLMKHGTLPNPDQEAESDERGGATPGQSQIRSKVEELEAKWNQERSQSGGASAATAPTQNEEKVQPVDLGITFDTQSRKTPSPKLETPPKSATLELVSIAGLSSEPFGSAELTTGISNNGNGRSRTPSPITSATEARMDLNKIIEETLTSEENGNKD